METSVITNSNTTTTVQNKDKKAAAVAARSEEDREYEDDDTSIKRIKVRSGSKQDLLDLPAGTAQSIMYSSRTSKHSRRSPFDTSSSNLKINEGIFHRFDSLNYDY